MQQHNNLSMDMDVDQIPDLTQPSHASHLQEEVITHAIQTQTEDEIQHDGMEIGLNCFIEPKDTSKPLPISSSEVSVLTEAIRSNSIGELLRSKVRVLDCKYVESGRPTFGVDETLILEESIVTASPASDKGLVGDFGCIEGTISEDNHAGAGKKDLDAPDTSSVSGACEKNLDHSQEMLEFMPEQPIRSKVCDVISGSSQSVFDWERMQFPFSDMPDETKLESILHKVKALTKLRSSHSYRTGGKGVSRNKGMGIEESKQTFKRRTSPQRIQANLQYNGSSSKMPNDELFDNDSECIEETLSAFKNHLIRKKKAEKLKRKGNAKARGFEKITDESTDYRHALQHTHDCMEISKHLQREPVTLVTKTQNELACDVVKEALLEVGFAIELRPRQSRECNDFVYVSPEGHVYWSLPKAWEALKQGIAKSKVDIDGIGSSRRRKYEKEILYGRKMCGLGKVDKRTLKQVLLSFGKDKRLLSALKKSCNFSGTSVQDIISQVEVTNVTLADILLVDLGLLKRLTSKSKGRDAFEMPIPIDKREERKRKRDGNDNSMTDDFTLMRKNVQSNQVKKAFQHTLKISKIDNMSRCQTVHKESGKKKLSKKDVSKITKTKSKNQGASSEKGKKARPQNGFRLEARALNIDDVAENNVEWTLFSWMIDRGAVLEKEKIFCVDCVSKQTLKEGVVTRDGIVCRCCKKLFTSPAFELHATHNAAEPVCDLIFSSGRSIIDHQLESWKTELDFRKTQNYVGVSTDDTNDDTCILCGDGGDLICCDQCPSTFHMSCLEIDDIPEGNWYCPKCRCGKCSRSVHSVKEELAMVRCNQCEHYYHSACLRSSPTVDGKLSFCGHACQKIFSRLRQLVGVPQPLVDGFSWSLLRCMDKDRETERISNKAIIEQHSKLAVALLLIKECFNPMIDPRTNIDMITQSMYNRWSEFDRLNYDGFYTAILEKEGEIISVATVRVHGSRLAEMPLIGTQQKYRRKGMCRLLVDVIEKLLQSLEVSTFVLPAIPELFDTWIHAFGFKPSYTTSNLEIKDLSLMVFPGTQLLQKDLLEMLIVDKTEEEITETALVLAENKGRKMLDTGKRPEITAGLKSSMFAVTDSIENIFADSSVVSSSQPQDVIKDIFANRTLISS